MPCSDGGVPYPPSPEELAHARFVKRAEPLLCSACRALEGFGYDFDLNPELSEWWAKHKAADAARAAAEEKVAWEKRVCADALKKPFGDLSVEEKNLLKKHGYFR